MLNPLRICKNCGLTANTPSELDQFLPCSSCKYGKRPLCKKCYNKTYLNIYTQKSLPNLKRRLKEIKRRCYDPKSTYYYLYGGHGITVCEEWRTNRQAFIDWALNNGYKKGLQIDRVDNNDLYSPKNCRWVTPKKQALNRRNNTTNYDKKTRICGVCHKELPFSEFTKDKSNPAGIASRCRICLRKYAKTLRLRQS